MSTLNKKAQNLLKSFKLSEGDKDMVVLLVEKILFNQQGDHLSMPYMHKCTASEFAVEYKVYHTLGLTVHQVVNVPKGCEQYLEDMKTYQPKVVIGKEQSETVKKSTGRPRKDSITKGE